MRAPIDTNLFTDAAEPPSISCQTVVRAPRAAVFRAWTDAAALTDLFDPPFAAELQLAVGGRYEWRFDGVIGSNDCQVLSYLPDRMLSFSWNAPLEQPESRAWRTWVVVEFDDAGGDDRTRIRLTHLGFGVEAHWEQTKAYFAEAWPRVLAAFAAGLDTGP